MGTGKFLSLCHSSDGYVLLSVEGLGAMYRLQQLLERQTKVVGYKHSPLLWRLLLWSHSVVLSNRGKQDKVSHTATHCLIILC